MGEQGEAKKRRGRPPMNVEDRKGGNLTFRVRDGMRERLQASADTRGLSISEDIEKRIERTFDYDYLLGDNPTAVVFRSIAGAVRRFEQSSGKSWIEDSETQERVHEAVSQMVNVLLGMRQEIDDRKSTGAGLPIDWNDMEMRVGFRTEALDRGIEALQDYRNGLEQELKVLVRKGRIKREGRVYAFRVRALLSKATREDLVRIATALTNCDDNTNVAAAFTQGGMVVHQQGADGTWRPVSTEWTHSHDPSWLEDTDEVLKAWIEEVLKLEPAPPVSNPAEIEPSIRPATPDEIAGMVEAPGQLPESIGGRAIFDDAVSGLPLVKAEKAGTVKRPDDGDDLPPVPVEVPAPKRRARAKATA